MTPELPTVRPMTFADLDAVEAIQAACPEAAHWPPRDYLAHSAFVAECGGAVAGFLVLRTTAPDEAEILNLAVAPAHRRQGVARALLTSAILDRQNLYLEVRESNQAARSFYHALGFASAGRRPGYYRDPPEAAIVMHSKKC